MFLFLIVFYFNFFFLGSYSVFFLTTAFPLTIVQNLPNVALLLTAHGGHIAFLQGLFPRGESYMERLFGQFVQAVFDHPSDINEACCIGAEQESWSVGPHWRTEQRPEWNEYGVSCIIAVQQQSTHTHTPEHCLAVHVVMPTHECCLICVCTEGEPAVLYNHYDLTAAPPIYLSIVSGSLWASNPTSQAADALSESRSQLISWRPIFLSMFSSTHPSHLHMEHCSVWWEQNEK